MMRHDGDRVYLDLHIDDWHALLFALGTAAGATEDRAQFRGYLRLVNRINEGNPHFTPYEVEPEEQPA